MVSCSTTWPQGHPDVEGPPFLSWVVRSSSDLTTARRELASHASEMPAAGEGWAGAISLPDTLALLLSELVTNALRHASPPAEVTVVLDGGRCLLDVADPDVTKPPSPEHDRSPGLGGHGLPLVALLAHDRGWYVEGSRKHVWACLGA
ncbi:ATP-binding protein [uncultured Pseudokineococcus sp.]|uniref:ATP-binding protein n=1 Tax=uncultured Pseudokineococcus sp. TaxID=1642928 RepID=UPI0026267F42|nr:ATP-binding protein [uncultured Pseudokineococcus sp.]